MGPVILNPATALYNASPVDGASGGVYRCTDSASTIWGTERSDWPPVKLAAARGARQGVAT
ncbi:hypothetical protein N7462_006682 [Penicillium macrosclerotiorum]|uniref:uncharacterized protein n=1 Tax=Penicillium macrosclerotiorum TaxID=303699 RepID=UPI002546BBEA|nr:uncharacterized protein N7462_006682 [Penicillium macrosclerotiorum]KAJ5683517.1 hypothetical protein N7462_006682 [Penicillium macrosclerotiorum]